MSTHQRVFELADELLIEGIRPSQSKIRELIEGQPSNTTIGDALRDYWDDLGSRILTLRSRPDIPQPLFEAIKGVWDAALGHAEATYQEKQRQLAQKESEANARVEKAALDRQAALERMEVLHNDIEAAGKQARYLEGLLQSERERRTDVEQQSKRLEEKLQHREREIERLQTVMEEKIAATESQVAQERSRSEQTENRWHQEIDRLRQANEKQQKTHSKALSDAQEKQQALETALLQSRDQVASLVAKRSALEGQLQVLEERIERQENQRQAVELRVENLQLKVEAEHREKTTAVQALALVESREAQLHERLHERDIQYNEEQKQLIAQEQALRSRIRELETALQTTKKAVKKKKQRD